MNERVVMLGLRVPLIYLMIGLAMSSICPADRVNTTHDVTSSASNGGQVTIQQGILQQISCTTFRPGENIGGVIWYRGNSANDPNKLRLIGSLDDVQNNYFALTSKNSLIIKDVTKQDEGNYVCIVVPFGSIDRYVVVDVHVIESTFQAVKADVKATSSLAQSVRHRISCPCDTTSSSTVYWSQGTGVTSETEILCARFPDGTVLQFQGGNEFGVAADSSLIINSLQNTRETARFWCHVFKPDGSLINCNVDAKIVKDEQPSNKALQASKDSFYVLKGEAQTLPCTDGPISEQTCEIQWFKDVSSTTNLLLNYTAWNDVTYSVDGFDLGSDFALVIKSADEENGGVYICKTKSQSRHMEVRVIGDTFPLDNGNISRVKEITFEAGQTYTLECMIGSNTTKSGTAFWSFGQKDAFHTTVIGTFKLPDKLVGTKDLERNSCYKITVDGALQLTGCLIDSDVRYWCHVFLDGVLYRYYWDLVVQDSLTSFSILVAIIIPIIAIIVCLVAALCWKYRLFTPSHTNYVMVDLKDSWEAVKPLQLIGVVKEKVMERLRRVPTTPWVTEDTTSYSWIGDVFKPLQLFINHKAANHTIRYQLESEDKIFDDGNRQLKRKHVVLEGKAGSGKTTLLHKLAFDMYTGRAEALLGQVRVTFILPADLLLQLGNLGEAVFQQLGQPKQTKISPKFINSFCKDHSDDVAILIDDCAEVGPVMDIIRKQGLLGAYVVMTTRQIREKYYGSEFNFHHVTVSGFTPTDARSYIKCILDDKRSKELIRYLDEHLLPPDVESLPLNLTALCQLSSWTDGEVFRNRLRTSELFYKLVKCLFDGAAYKTKRQVKGLSSDRGLTMEVYGGGGQILKSHQLTQDQQGGGSGQTEAGLQLTPDQQGGGSGQIAAGLQLTQDQQGDSSGQTAAGLQLTQDQQGGSSGQTAAGLQLTQDQQGGGSGQTAAGLQLTQDQLELLVKFGKIVLPRVLENHGNLCELSRKDFDQFVENKNNAFDEGVRVGLLCVRAGGSASQTEQKAQFVLEILQDLCVGLSLTQTDQSLSSRLDKMVPFGTTFAKVFLFAGLRSYNDYASIMEIITKALGVVTSDLSSLKPIIGKSVDPRKWKTFLELTQRQMQLFEICLQLEHESKGKVKLPIKTVSSWFSSKGKIRLIGVSSHKLRLLLYFLLNPPVTSKVKFIKLLRLGKHPSKELRKYLEYFLPYVFEDTDKETSELMKSDSENLTLKALLERVECTLRGVVDEGSPCQFELDTSVILALQSSFLQDTMLSQSDECCLSTPAKDLVKCLIYLKNLEKIVLIGSILSSETICELARNLKKLPWLKRLDLRLNKQTDDAAFLEVTQSASSCQNLVDLRLSLYKVTLQGYGDVTRCVESNTEGWKRLKKLFLLHGSPTEEFVSFLSNVMKYLKNVEDFNISALNPTDDLSHEAIDRFRDSIKLMKSLKRIEIENMKGLRTTLKTASKDQKQQESSIYLPIERAICDVFVKSPVTEEDFVVIPGQTEKKPDQEGHTEELETTQV